MKKYSQIRLNESSLKQDDKSRFIAYATQKANAMLENGNYAFHLSSLFEDAGSYEQKLKNLLARYYPDESNESFEEAKKKFDNDFISVSDADDLISESLTSYFTAVANNPNDPLSHTLLKEALFYDPMIASSILIQESLRIAKYIDVSNFIDKSLTENLDLSSSVFGEDRSDYVQILESLMRGLIYTNNDECRNVYESLSNVLRIYKEGITIVKSNETSTIELFKQYLNTGSQSIVYTVAAIQQNAKDPASLALLCMSYFDIWVNLNINRLMYKFKQDDFVRLNNIQKEFIIHIGRDFDDELEVIQVNTSFEKLYQTLDLLQGISQNVRMDLRPGISKYISIIRPMIDTIRHGFRMINQKDDTFL